MTKNELTHNVNSAGAEEPQVEVIFCRQLGAQELGPLCLCGARHEVWKQSRKE